jgi:alpha-tubulin suppressor-like RCC1 family protein
MAATSDGAIVLKTDGSVWGWGSSQYGELGGGGAIFTSRVICEPIQLAADALDVALGEDFIMILNKAGTVFVQGNALNGALGKGRMQPEYVGGREFLTGANERVKIPKAVGIAASGRTLFAFTENGSVFTWGEDIFGKKINWSPVPFSWNPAAY